jgi:hypothetical protein
LRIDSDSADRTLATLSARVVGWPAALFCVSQKPRIAALFCVSQKPRIAALVRECHNEAAQVFRYVQVATQQSLLGRGVRVVKRNLVRAQLQQQLVQRLQLATTRIMLDQT